MTVHFNDILRANDTKCITGISNDVPFCEDGDNLWINGISE